MYDIPPTFLPLDNNLINGKNNFDCDLVKDGTACNPNVDLSKFKLRSGKTHRLRLINAGGTDNQKFTIDDHEMLVIANDYVSVVPYQTKVVTLGVGQRTDVIVKATGSPTDAVWMRADLDLDEFCGNTTTIQSHALAAVYYERADTNVQPKTSPIAWSSNNCANVSKDALRGMS